ncbi:MAG: 50S ribosomal protein L13 [Candidatus Marinimicrobia bacterium]|nr:50S ribosomal protein L13 [Candidatus Neomarinimicrobiota bacterium]
MKTFSIKQVEIEKDWYLADASGQTLGRFASRIATILRGKHKPTYTPHMDMGDYVIVINAAKIRITGEKEKDKKYFSHSGYPGGSKFKSLHDLRIRHPERIIIHAVKGMLPHNRLGRKMLKNLKVYAGSDHPHSAQKPKLLEV